MAVDGTTDIDSLYRFTENVRRDLHSQSYSKSGLDTGRGKVQRCQVSVFLKFNCINVVMPEVMHDVMDCISPLLTANSIEKSIRNMSDTKKTAGISRISDKISRRY